MPLSRTLLLVFLVFSLLHGQGHAQNLDCTDPGGVQTVVDGYFRILSGPAGAAREWDGFRDLFLGTARLDVIGLDAEGANQFYPQSLPEFIEHVESYVRGHGFYQRDGERHTRCDGRIAHVWTAFESWGQLGLEPIDRGRMSLHLLHEGDIWRITHVMWQSAPRQGRRGTM